MTDPISEVAKATGEIANATGKGIDATRQAGSYLARITRLPVETVMAAWNDRLVVWRFERQIDLLLRAKDKLQSIGINEPKKYLPLTITLPLLEAAALVEDDYLRDKWENLLANGLYDAPNGEIRRAYVSILEQLTADDARLLKMVYDVEAKQFEGIWTGNLPTSLRLATDDDKEHVFPDDATRLSLENLDRLGCLKTSRSVWGGSYAYSPIFQTALGETFMKAVAPPGG